MQCEVCHNGPAFFYCEQDEAAMCKRCDAEVHAANPVSALHKRCVLSENGSTPSLVAPECDICQEKKAVVFCREDRALLCRGCDFSIHSMGPAAGTHERYLMSGMRISLNAEAPSPSGAATCSSRCAESCCTPVGGRTRNAGMPFKMPQNMQPAVPAVVAEEPILKNTDSLLQMPSSYLNDDDFKQCVGELDLQDFAVPDGKDENLFMDMDLLEMLVPDISNQESAYQKGKLQKQPSMNAFAGAGSVPVFDMDDFASISQNDDGVVPSFDSQPVNKRRRMVA